MIGIVLKGFVRGAAIGSGFIAGIVAASVTIDAMERGYGVARKTVQKIREKVRRK